MKHWVYTLFMSFLSSCFFVAEEKKHDEVSDTSHTASIVSPVLTPPAGITPPVTDMPALPHGSIDTRKVSPQEVVAFAKTLIGVPYKYASSHPTIGFDCSGFITYVFSHFNIIVPRSSISFTNVGKEVGVTMAKPGDLILFTGTDSTERFVGHMGLIVSNTLGNLEFIHSTSGKKYGVTITPLNGYYKGRYVKTIRIFPQND